MKTSIRAFKESTDTTDNAFAAEVIKARQAVAKLLEKLETLKTEHPESCIYFYGTKKTRYTTAELTEEAKIIQQSLETIKDIPDLDKKEYFKNIRPEISTIKSKYKHLNQKYYKKNKGIELYIDSLNI